MFLRNTSFPMPYAMSVFGCAKIRIHHVLDRLILCKSTSTLSLYEQFKNMVIRCGENLTRCWVRDKPEFRLSNRFNGRSCSMRSSIVTRKNEVKLLEFPYTFCRQYVSTPPQSKHKPVHYWLFFHDLGNFWGEAHWSAKITSSSPCWQMARFWISWCWVMTCFSIPCFEVCLQVRSA